MDDRIDLVLFILEGKRYALHLGKVHRVIQAAEITPLPGAPNIVLGVIHVEDSVIPVFNVRKRFGLPGKDLEPEDQFILAYTAKRIIGLSVDHVEGVVSYSNDYIVKGHSILPGLAYVNGVTATDDGIIVIHDIDRFLSLEEEKKMEKAIKQ